MQDERDLVKTKKGVHTYAGLRVGDFWMIHETLTVLVGGGGRLTLPHNPFDLDSSPAPTRCMHYIFLRDVQLMFQRHIQTQKIACGR